MKIKEHKEARRLRRERKISIKQIADQLGVAKSTVSIWVRDLPLSENRMKELNIRHKIKGGKNRALIARNQRRQYQLVGYEMARNLKNDPLFVGGCMLHWAEGAKDKNSLRICNTDPHLLRLWIKFIIKFWEISPNQFTLRIQSYLDCGMTMNEIEAYWLSVLDLPSTCLRKATVVTEHPMSTGFKKGKHPYGTAHLGLYLTEILQQIWGAIKFLGDIDDDDRWLD